MFRIFALAVVCGLLGATTLIVADPPQFLYRFCLVSQDHNERAIAREACNDFAQANGFARGVIRPSACLPGQECEEEECEEPEEGEPAPRPYMCVGVGGH